MLAAMRRPSSTAATMVAKLSSSRTISDESRATSVPRMPIAIPTSAPLSAGASLTPSPVITTTWSRLRNASRMRSLWRGSTLAKMAPRSTISSS